MIVDRGKLYQTNKVSWLHYNDYTGKKLQQGHVVVMIRRFWPYHETHWVLCDDELGWIETHDLEWCTNDATG